jgi:signal transduction histidine kinase
VAHDFNNMLTAIIGYSEMVMMDCREDDPIYLQLEVIKKSAERASTLTRQLLAFSRKQLLQLRVTNLNTVITDLEKMLRRLIGEDIHLLLELDPKLGAVKTDPGQIEQIIMNLVINARDAMPIGGKLTIQTANVYLDEAYSRRHGDLSPGPYAQIAVIDEGLSIDRKPWPMSSSLSLPPKKPTKAPAWGCSPSMGSLNRATTISRWPARSARAQSLRFT